MLYNLPILLCLHNSTILLLLFLIGQLIPTVHFRYQIVKYLILTFYGFSCLLCILQILRNTCVSECERELLFSLRRRSSLRTVRRTEAQKKTGNNSLK